MTFIQILVIVIILLVVLNVATLFRCYLTILNARGWQNLTSRYEKLYNRKEEEVTWLLGIIELHGIDMEQEEPFKPEDE